MPERGPAVWSSAGVKSLGTLVGSPEFVETVGSSLIGDGTRILAGNPQAARFAVRIAVVGPIRRTSVPSFFFAQFHQDFSIVR